MAERAGHRSLASLYMMDGQHLGCQKQPHSFGLRGPEAMNVDILQEMEMDGIIHSVT